MDLTQTIVNIQLHVPMFILFSLLGVGMDAVLVQPGQGRPQYNDAVAYNVDDIHESNWFYEMSYNRVYNHDPGMCKVVHDGPKEGYEDVSILPNGKAYISAGFNTINGRILRFDMKNPDNGFENLKIRGRFDRDGFRPHGLSLWTDKRSGEVTIMIVSHPPDRDDRIEIFRHDPDTNFVTYVRSVTDPLLFHVNDLVATGPNMFYSSQDRGKGHDWAHILIYSKTDTNIHYYDGTRAHVVATGINSGNGINLSPDGRYLYAAELLTGSMKVFRKWSTFNLTLEQVVQLNTAVDNIEVNPNNGDLWIANHPNLFRAFLLFYKNDKILSPSQVMRLTTKDGLVDTATEVYANDGRQLTASTAAAYYDNKFIVGTFNNVMLYCEIRCPDYNS